MLNNGVTQVPQLFLAKISLVKFLLFFFFKILFIYLLDRHRSQVGRDAGSKREEEAGSPGSREPNVGIHPRNLSQRQRL